MTPQPLERALQTASNRLELWTSFMREVDVRSVAEVGVFRGEFAEAMLRSVPSIDRYIMVDPWRHLDAWNKPANKSDDVFDAMYQEVLDRTAFAHDRCVVLRGTTLEVIDQVPDESLDLVYIDGDHTLRGITSDLINWTPKVRSGGWIVGDDFAPRVWQHGHEYEPTMVFPFAVYFAEASDLPIWSLKWAQFIIRKSPDSGFEFTDLVGRYPDLDLHTLLAKPPPRRRRPSQAP